MLLLVKNATTMENVLFDKYVASMVHGFWHLKWLKPRDLKWTCPSQTEKYHHLSLE